MTIRLTNTLTGEIEEFQPLKKGEVGIYTCGPTVYDYAHIGNFRTFVFEDLLRRFLEFQGFRVKHVMNVTDVDDKTIAGAVREHKSLKEYTEFYTRAFLEDLKVLNILPPTLQPKATDEIHGSGGMIELIKGLVDKGFAYESDGSVYYRVSKFSDYGKLSGKDIDRNIVGARVDSDEYEKEAGTDFVLWKKSKEGEPGWDSPWGMGRPGWHIECSAMSMKYLGKTFDIHAGGEDLIFPHHENEIAQSEAFSQTKPFVRYWLHCKFLLVNGEKMSKSKGNFYTLRDLLKQGADPMAIRFALLAVSYRMPLNFTFEGLEAVSEIIKKLDDCYFDCLSRFCDKTYEPQREPDAQEKERMQVSLKKSLESYMNKIIGAFSNDLAISIAVAEILTAVSHINSDLTLPYSTSRNEENVRAAIGFFGDIDRLLGLDISSVKDIPADVQKRVIERNKVRQHSDFKKDKTLQAKSDVMRGEIEKMGWLVKDSRPGEASRLKKKRRTWESN
ncbi:MAG: cysteine--tRNA ligase [Candidatus Omnitrophica bacterium]|nr:cysteine--tRNA ligase [Candidatus Omnitrophota bacterium]